jgi:predicted homoserine dehydrogenase-like protein
MALTEGVNARVHQATLRRLGSIDELEEGMSLHGKLLERAAQGKPLRVGLIGAGKFGAMFLAQIPRLPGMHLVAIGDFSPANAKKSLERVGWKPEQYGAGSLDEAMKKGTTCVSDNWEQVVAYPAIDVIVECTGNPVAAVEHCLTAFKNGKHVVNVTVEADAFCGALLARRAKEAGVVYSLAFGDQPALICDWVDWARGCGFPVVAAGRGHKWLPHYFESTPETVWNFWGLTAEQAALGGLNPKMFNSFLDGSKPAIECTAVANATGLEAPENGLTFPPASMDDLPIILRPKSEGGMLDKKGVVETVSSLRLDGTAIEHDIRNGVWVCVEGETDYIRRCFQEYGVRTDPSGRYVVIYRRWHLIGLEVGISVASVGLRQEATGAAICFNADVVATAKRDLAPGEMLDGEGGYTVYGKISPAKKSLALGNLPLGLASNLKVVRPVAKGQSLTWDDVKRDETLTAYAIRKEMEELTADTVAVPA